MGGGAKVVCVFFGKVPPLALAVSAVAVAVEDVATKEAMIQ